MSAPVPLFRIDAERCLRDGLCAAACPLGLVVQIDADSLPEPLKDKEYRCIGCGHCASVCPTGALELTALPAGFEPVRKDLTVSSEQAEQFMRSRRSIRRYKDEAVPEALLVRVLDTARWAPSGHNVHPVRWSVIRSRAGVAAVAAMIAHWMAEQAEAGTDLAKALHLGGVARSFETGRDLITRGAPHLATAFAPKKGVTPNTDAVIAASHADLAAHAHGLGTCWCGYAMMAAHHHEPVLRALGVPEGHDAGACLMLGYPRVRYRRIPPRPKPDITWLD